MALPPCTHVPPCPPADATDHDAAKRILHDYTAGFSLLCNGVAVFDDGGELSPGGVAIPAQRGPAPHTLVPVTV